MGPDTVILVPARLASTRFPRKLLHPVCGRPLILWVAERIRAEAPEFPLWFAVEDEELRAVLVAAGHRALLTAAHPSGTDRLAEANRTLGARRVINVQADEPLVTGGQIRALAALLAAGFPMATLAQRLTDPAAMLNPNIVKVVVGAGGRALYFSRAPIPYPRDCGGPAGVDAAWLAAHPAYRHLGLYAYEAGFLRQFTAWPPGRLEQLEKLEQLRVLENGAAIGVGFTDEPTLGVDVPEDADLLERALTRRAPPG